MHFSALSFTYILFLLFSGTASMFGWHRIGIYCTKPVRYVNALFFIFAWLNASRCNSATPTNHTDEVVYYFTQLDAGK